MHSNTIRTSKGARTSLFCGFKSEISYRDSHADIVLTLPFTDVSPGTELARYGRGKHSLPIEFYLAIP